MAEVTTEQPASASAVNTPVTTPTVAGGVIQGFGWAEDALKVIDPGFRFEKIHDERLARFMPLPCETTIPPVTGIQACHDFLQLRFSHDFQDIIQSHLRQYVKNSDTRSFRTIVTD
ncbi:MAG: hypothetical protein HQL98_13525 [Magnetococcales bacterium]|nr:hypothetical protein [Magnetococcales bacterium]